MQSTLHLLAEAMPGTISVVGKYGTETVFGVAFASVVVLLWQLYVRVARPAQEMSLKVAELNSTSAMANRDAMQSFERAMVTHKASVDELRETADLTARNLARQERLTNLMIAHTGKTGEQD